MGTLRGIPSAPELREVLGPLLRSFEAVEAATVEIGPATEGLRVCLVVFAHRLGRAEQRMIDALSIELRQHFDWMFSLLLRQWRGMAQIEGRTVVFRRDGTRAATG